MLKESCILLMCGSSGDIYSVVVSRVDGKTGLTCTCQAGQKSVMCKHRQAVIDGDDSSLTEPQVENWTWAQETIESSSIRAAIEQLEYNLQDNFDQQKELLKTIDPEMNKLKAEVKQLKKVFAAMLERGI